MNDEEIARALEARARRMYGEAALHERLAAKLCPVKRARDRGEHLRLARALFYRANRLFDTARTLRSMEAEIYQPGRSL